MFAKQALVVGRLPLNEADVEQAVFIERDAHDGLLSAGAARPTVGVRRGDRLYGSLKQYSKSA